MSAPAAAGPMVRGIILDSTEPSRNRRLYTRQCLARMVERARAAVAAGTIPLKASHDPDDDALRVVGQVTSVELAESGTQVIACARLLPTLAGMDAAALTAGPTPAVSWSIEAMPCAPAARETLNGAVVDVYSDVELTGIALTAFPGVPAARFLPESRRRAGVITESYRAQWLTEAADVDLSTLSPSELRRYAAAAFGVGPTPAPPATDAPEPLQGTPSAAALMAAELRAWHDGLIASQRRERGAQ